MSKLLFGNQADISAYVGMARGNFGSQVAQVRADSGTYGNPAVDISRCVIRQFAQDACRADSRKAAQVANAISFGLGYQNTSGVVTHPLVQADSFWAANTVTYATRPLIEAPWQAEMLRASIPVQNVPDWAEYVDLQGVDYEGSIGVYQPGMTEVPKATPAYSGKQQRMFSFVCYTDVPWVTALQSNAPGAMDVIAQSAEAARRFIQLGMENLYANGLAGIDFVGLNNLTVSRTTSDLNYSLSGSTLGDIATDMAQAVNAVRIANDYRGMGPNVALIGPRLASLLRAKNNLNAGGIYASGLEAVMQVLAAEGITRVIVAPSLQGSDVGANFDRILFMRDDSGLQQLIGMAPAPIKTVQTLTSEQTLWAVRLGGLAAIDATGVGIFNVQVAA